jgi:hypothetical protein
MTEPLLLTMLNSDKCPEGDMRMELIWFCGLCNSDKKTLVTEDEVRAFLRNDQGRPDLAEAFSTSYLLAWPE